MKAILKQLYDGEIYPAEQFYPKVEEYQEFTQIMDEQLSAIPLEISEMFIEGFRLGARMMIEIYGNDISDKK